MRVSACRSYVSKDTGHASRCTKEDYLTLNHATWHNVTKNNLTGRISFISVQAKRERKRESEKG